MATTSPSVSIEERKSKTSGCAVLIALLAVLALLAFATVGFFRTPAGRQEWNKIGTAFATYVPDNMPLPGGAVPADPGFVCPEGITLLGFDEKGALSPPYPALKPEAQRFCFDAAKYEAFLSLKGKTEDGRAINGLDWLAETLAYPDHPSMLDQIKVALKDVHQAGNLQTVGWIEIPGYGNAPAEDTPPEGLPNSDPNPDWDSDSNPPPQNPPPADTPTIEPTWTVEPTDTPLPTIVVADIPTLVYVTPAGPVATQLATTPTPWAPAPVMEIDRATEQARQATLAVIMPTRVADALAASCIQIVEATRFYKLDEIGIWSNIQFLEFRWGQDGLYAFSDRLGGNGPDAGKSKVCVRQILDAPPRTFSIAERINATWDFSQVRVVPMFGQGDGRTNGRECLFKGLWHFNCTVMYQALPTPIPQLPPTPVPIPLTPMDNWFNQHAQAWTTSCQINGSHVLMKVGGTCEATGGAPLVWVDFTPVWGFYLGGEISTGPCGQLRIMLNPDTVMQFKETDKCFAPFKAK